jgi:hypothetical protein
MMRKVGAAVGTVVLSIALLGGMAGPAFADKTKTCTESTGRDHFVQTNDQTSACNSNSDTGFVDKGTSNNGGNQPPGQQ